MTGEERRLGVALSPRPTGFAPVLFAGRLEEGLDAAAELGFSAVELSIRSPADVEPDALGAMLERRGLSLSALATGPACLADHLCLDSADPDVRTAAAARLAGAVELADRFGAAVIVGGIRGRLEAPPAERPARREGALAVLRPTAHLASRLGVTLVLEPINRYETAFVNTVDEGLALLGEIDEPSMGLLLDTFHMNIEEPSLGDAIRKAGTRLHYVHVADSNRQAPGHGHLDFAAVAAALDDAGYRGPVVAEILPVPDDHAAARDASSFLTSLLSGAGVNEPGRGDR